VQEMGYENEGEQDSIQAFRAFCIQIVYV
jgi:hypothetical protein